MRMRVLSALASERFGQLDAALAFATQVTVVDQQLGGDPNRDCHCLAHTVRGRLLARRGEFAQAEGAFEQAILSAQVSSRLPSCISRSARQWLRRYERFCCKGSFEVQYTQCGRLSGLTHSLQEGEFWCLEAVAVRELTEHVLAPSSRGEEGRRRMAPVMARLALSEQELHRLYRYQI
jgi:hypothetical protein